MLPGLKDSFGIHVPQNLVSLCCAIRYRTANKTLQGWKHNFQALSFACDSHGSVFFDANGQASNWKSPSHWKIQPFAQTLKEAAFVD